MIGRDHVVSGLIEKRRELAGIIDELQRQLDQHRADLTHIDGVLRVLVTDLNPETIRPKRIYRRNRYFARNELSRLSLGVLRTAAGELLSTDEIAGRVITVKGFDAAIVHLTERDAWPILYHKEIGHVAPNCTFPSLLPR